MGATVISGRYQLGDRLGSGGMSTVYKAIDRVLERTVAVKVLAEHLSDDDKFVARFRREALAVAKLIHPNIVQVYDTGIDRGRHYIVMEYVEGRSGSSSRRCCWSVHASRRPIRWAANGRASLTSRSSAARSASVPLSMLRASSGSPVRQSRITHKTS